MVNYVVSLKLDTIFILLPSGCLTCHASSKAPQLPSSPVPLIPRVSLITYSVGEARPETAAQIEGGLGGGRCAFPLPPKTNCKRHRCPSVSGTMTMKDTITCSWHNRASRIDSSSSEEGSSSRGHREFQAARDYFAFASGSNTSPRPGAKRREEP